MKKHPLLYIVLSVVLMFSCKPQTPDTVIQPDEFENILYDFHLADAMAEDENTGQTDSYTMALNRMAVLKKHGISQADFDSSLVYYVRHADRLHKIYEDLSKRFSDEALSLGASANDLSRYGNLKSERDTSNLWSGATSYVLTAVTPYNVITFNITADSTYHKGDKIIFSFDTDFIYQSGSREGKALLAVEYKNDSISSKTVSITSNSNYSIMVDDGNRLGIKSIRGFIYLHDSDKANRGSDLRIMSAYNIRLIRMRSGNTPPVSSPATNATNNGDSMKTDMPNTPEVQRQTGKPANIPPEHAEGTNKSNRIQTFKPVRLIPASKTGAERTRLKQAEQLNLKPLEIKNNK